jgi:hypothetical protein
VRDGVLDLLELGGVEGHCVAARGSGQVVQVAFGAGPEDELCAVIEPMPPVAPRRR